MKSFLLDCIGFTVALFASFLLMGFINRQYAASDLYMQEFHEKELMAAKESVESRVLFLGGSNLAFGLDSKLLSDSLHKPVLNLGLHAGLGLKLILDTYIPYVRKGDIVVISPEYGHFWNETAYGEPTAMGDLPYVDNFLDYLYKCNYTQIKNICIGCSQQTTRYFLTSVFSRNTSQKTSTPYFIYTKSGFNDYGDEISHLTLEPIKVTFGGHRINNVFNEQFFMYFVNSIKGLTESGIKVYLIPPTTCNDNYIINEDLIQDLTSRFNVNGLYWLGNPSDFSYDNSLMYDTPYHLNELGRASNSNKILNFLQKELAD